MLYLSSIFVQNYYTIKINSARFRYVVGHQRDNEEDMVPPSDVYFPDIDGFDNNFNYNGLVENFGRMI